MTARSGMANLIKRLRQLCEAGTADYSVAGVTYWADDDLQGVLDEHRTRQVEVPLTARPDYVDGTSIYTRYEIPWAVGNAVEGTASGTANFRVADSTGALIAFSGFTFNERDLSVDFAADTEGSARYWSGFSYDLNAAAQQVWLTKAGHAYTAINFTADGHRFEREALHAHCLKMAERFGYIREVQVSRLKRTDLGGAEADVF